MNFCVCDCLFVSFIFLYVMIEITAGINNIYWFYARKRSTQLVYGVL